MTPSYVPSGVNVPSAARTGTRLRPDSTREKCSSTANGTWAEKTREVRGRRS